uniref:Uncharacterized protein n=1 Tax=Strongyloides stercoralis TaxID=6248 RepID=A0A0K0EB83_STRER
MTFNILKKISLLFILTIIVLFSLTCNGIKESNKNKENNEDGQMNNQELFFDKNTTFFCSYYSKCLDILEERYRECLMHPKKKKEKYISKKCEMGKKFSQKVLSGNILRKIEITKDCVNKNILESENINLSEKKMNKCNKVIESYLDDIVIPKSLETIKHIYNKEKEKTKTPLKQIRRCFKTKKFWQKQCHTLSKCCSIGKKCEMGNNKFMEIKLTNERKNLNDISCNNEK